MLGFLGLTYCGLMRPKGHMEKEVPARSVWLTLCLGEEEEELLLRVGCTSQGYFGVNLCHH